MHVFGVNIPLVELAALYMSLIVVFLIAFTIHLRRLRLYLMTELREVKEFEHDVKVLEKEEEKLEREEERLEREEETLLEEEKDLKMPKAIREDLRLRKKKK
ncbi:MAG: hypothetical protein ABH829_05365 [archaeon]